METTLTFRAAYWQSANGQADVLLTDADQANLPDDELRAAGEAVFKAEGLEMAGGKILIGNYTTD